MRQIELAKELGISKSYISMIMSGKRTPKRAFVKGKSSQKSVNFEAISSLRGRCPKPLDECAMLDYAGNYSRKCSQNSQHII